MNHFPNRICHQLQATTPFRSNPGQGPFGGPFCIPVHEHSPDKPEQREATQPCTCHMPSPAGWLFLSITEGKDVGVVPKRLVFVAR